MQSVRMTTSERHLRGDTGDMFVTVLLREFGPWIVRKEMRQTKKATLPARFTFSEDTKLCLWDVS
jgi:hypothetical protein